MPWYRTPLKLAMSLSLVGLTTMLVGAIMQLWGPQYQNQLGMLVHWYGGWLLWISAVWILNCVGRRDRATNKPVAFNLLLTEPNSPSATLAAANRRCFGRFGKIVLDNIQVTKELLDELKAVAGVVELDLRRAELPEDLLHELEHLLHIETIRLPPIEVEPRTLRELQIALPACQVLLADGTPVDLYGTVHQTETEQPSLSKR